MRVLDFTDGFSTSSAPDQGIVTATALKVFANDAAYVADKGSAASAGDAYFNSTESCVRVFDGSNWLCLEQSLKGQTAFTVANNQASAANVTDATFDSADYTSASVEWEILRSTDNPTEVMARGRCSLFYKPTAGWQIENESEGDDVGVTFTALDTAGVVQLQYTSTNLAGGSYVGTMKFTIKDQMRA